MEGNPLKSNRYLRLLAILFAFALVATACGGSDGDTDTTTSTSSESEGGEDLGAVDEDAATDAISEAAGEEADNTAAANISSIEDLEAVWADRRAEIVADIIDAGYGVDGDILTGPAGFSVDLSACPADWSDTEGISDGVISIGHTTAQSGTLAAYGNIGVGMDAYFNYINERGGVGPDGLQIELSIKDDAYDANLTQEYVNEFLQTTKPFYVTTLGTPPTFSVQPSLNEQCVPQPFVMTGHPAWGDPVNFPWTTGLQLNYFTEGVLWGGWIEENLSDEAPISVAALVADNDFGLAYERGFAEFAASSDIIGDVEFVRHDIAAPTLTNEITTLAATDPDVFISMTAGAPCTIAIQEVARAGLLESAKAVWTPSVCASISTYMEPAGSAAEGWLVFGGGWKDTTDPQWDDDVYIQWVNELVEDSGLDAEISLYGTGVGQFGWPHVQALLIAAELPGGLTRTNFMIAARSLSMQHPALLDGINFSATGNEDAYFVEGTQIQRFNVDEQTWVQEGGVIDLDGSSGTCEWDPDTGC